MDLSSKEQQLQEIEALESMYSNELRVLCKDFPNISVELDIRPDVEEFSDLFGKSEITLRATFPSEYPNCFPVIELPDFEGGYDENTLQRTKFWEECEQKVKMELDRVMDESVGMPMLFTLFGTLQEFFDQMAGDYLKNRDELERIKAEKIEREEQAKFEGTRVTAESFKKWNETFLKSVRSPQEKAKENQTTKRMTGKHLFLSDKSLNLSDLQFLDNVKDKSTVEIDQSLFEDDIEFDDDDDEDYDPEGGAGESERESK